MAITLTRAEARRIAVRAQALTLPRPASLAALVSHLTSLHAEPTAHVAPSAEIVAWSRLGSAHRLGDVARAAEDGSLIELRGMLRPAEDLALFRAEMAAWPGRSPLAPWQEAQRDWVEANDDCRREVLAKLYDEGPLPARELPDTTVVPWQSSGWNDNRNLRMMLECLVKRGDVALAGRDGRDPLWDLAERVYPDDPVVPLDEALAIRAARRLRSLGIDRGRSAEQPGELSPEKTVGVECVVEGVRGRWRVDPAYLSGPLAEPAPPRTVLLSPLDRLVFERKRMAELFEFDYQLEQYKPVAKRRWGYWAMPILHGDDLVGKLDATADRDAGTLRINAVHEDFVWPDEVRDAVRAEIAALAEFLDLELES